MAWIFTISLFKHFLVKTFNTQEDEIFVQYLISSSFKISIFVLIPLFPCYLCRLNEIKDVAIRNYLYISWLIESNNVRLIAFGEERIGLSRKKVEKNLFRQLDRTTVGQSSYPRRWRKYLHSNPNICTGCRNGQPYVTLIALVFVALYIFRLDKNMETKD